MEQQHMDEIELRDLVLVLWRYRKMIVALFLIAVLTSGLISFLVQQPVYVSSATLYLGNFNDPFFCDISAAREIILGDTILGEAAKAFIPAMEPGKLQSIKQSVQAEAVKYTPYLKITVTRDEPAQAQGILAKIIELFAEQSQPAYEQAQEQIREKSETIKARLEQVEQQIAATEAVISELENQNMSNIDIISQHLEAMNLLTSLNDKYVSLEDSYSSLEKQLQNLKPLQVISMSEQPAPIHPNRKLNVALAGVLSLMVGVFLAFIVDYFARNPLNLKAASK